jgi:hypothetical protein
MMAKNMHGSMGALLQAIHAANDPANLDQRQGLMQASQQQMPLYRDLADLAAQVHGRPEAALLFFLFFLFFFFFFFFF